MIEHVSFDFDGVLATGSNTAYVDCFHRALEEVGVSLDPELERQRILELWGRPVEEHVSLLLLEHPEKVPAAVEIFLEARRSPAFRAQVSLFPGAEDVLIKLAQDYSLSIVSGAERALIESVLGKQLLPLFSSIHSGYELTPELGKPSPYMLELAMQTAGTEPAKTAYLGDAPIDLRAAIAAKTTPMAILTGHLTRLQAQQIGAKLILEDIRELPDTVKSLS
jgi:phosphoglycolate phosphatase-like HAD superfamily hydrolase